MNEAAKRQLLSLRVSRDDDLVKLTMEQREGATATVDATIFTGANKILSSQVDIYVLLSLK